MPLTLRRIQQRQHMRWMQQWKMAMARRRAQPTRRQHLSPAEDAAMTKAAKATLPPKICGHSFEHDVIHGQTFQRANTRGYQGGCSLGIRIPIVF
eukprot:scaffold201900_cov31-Attheya_sp.AAC.1